MGKIDELVKMLGSVVPSELQRETIDLKVELIKQALLRTEEFRSFSEDGEYNDILEKLCPEREQESDSDCDEDENSKTELQERQENQLRKLRAELSAVFDSGDETLVQDVLQKHPWKNTENMTIKFSESVKKSVGIPKETELERVAKAHWNNRANQPQPRQMGGEHQAIQDSQLPKPAGQDSQLPKPKAATTAVKSEPVASPPRGSLRSRRRAAREKVAKLNNARATGGSRVGTHMRSSHTRWPEWIMKSGRFNSQGKWAMKHRKDGGHPSLEFYDDTPPMAWCKGELNRIDRAADGRVTLAIVYTRDRDTDGCPVKMMCENITETSLIRPLKNRITRTAVMDEEESDGISDADEWPFSRPSTNAKSRSRLTHSSLRDTPVRSSKELRQDKPATPHPGPNRRQSSSLREARGGKRKREDSSEPPPSRRKRKRFEPVDPYAFQGSDDPEVEDLTGSPSLCRRRSLRIKRRHRDLPEMPEEQESSSSRPPRTRLNSHKSSSDGSVTEDDGIEMGWSDDEALYPDGFFKKNGNRHRRGRQMKQESPYRPQGPRRKRALPGNLNGRRKRKQKRQPARPWTSSEVTALKEGVKKYGEPDGKKTGLKGVWSKILEDPKFRTTLANRKNTDLQGKWRNLKMKGI